MNEHRYHRGPVDPLAGPRRWVTRPAMPPVHTSTSATPTRETGELDLARLAAAAALEAMAAERKGRPLVSFNTIASPSLKALATQARREVARMVANQRADHHRALEG